MADHDFISKYCYGNMADYAINHTTGEFLMDDDHEPIKIKLNYMKMFSYVLLCFAGIGGIPKDRLDMRVSSLCLLSNLSSENSFIGC